MSDTQEERKSPLQQGRERDELITEIQGPFWATLLVQMGLFPNYEKAAKRIRQLFKKRQIKFIGRCEVRPDERPTFIYGNRRVKEDNLAHEVALSLMLARYYPHTTVLRLYDVDGALRPDATMAVNGVTYHVEYHTGTEGLAQVKERLKLYEGQDCVLLIVCRKPSQFLKVWKAAEPVKDIVYFASLQDVVNMKTPWDRVWMPHDWDPANQPGREKARITPPGQDHDQVAEITAGEGA